MPRIPARYGTRKAGFDGFAGSNDTGWALIWRSHPPSDRRKIAQMGSRSSFLIMPHRLS
jgi:hypothetical protein